MSPPQLVPGSGGPLKPQELQQSIVRLGSQRNVEQLLWRLHTGLPITIGLLGSSVAQMGGCLWQPMERCANYDGGGVRPGYPIGNFPPLHGEGFAVRLFRWINATWPHPEHRLYNGGLGTMPPQSSLACLFTHIPAEVHLVILEFGSQAAAMQHAAAESIVRALLALPSSPALAFLSVREWCASPRSTRVGHFVRFSWMESRGVLLRPETSTPWSRAEATFARLSDAYGIAALSHWAALYPRALADSGGQCACGRRRNMTLPYVPTDCLHPTKAPLGPKFMFEILQHWLLEAQERFGAGVRAASSRPATAAVALPEPIFGEAGAAPKTQARCYGFGHLMHHRGDVDTSKKLRGLDWRTMHCSGSGQCSQQNLNVECKKRVLSDPPPVWFYCASTLAATPKRDPGVVALTPGATLVLPVDTRVMHGEADPTVGRRAKLQVTLIYLASYDQMGRVGISCGLGCSCADHTVDAHRPPPPGERPVSAGLPHTFDVVGAVEDCVVTVRVLNASSSGRHKFKITQLAVHTPARSPGELRTRRRRRDSWNDARR